VLEGYVSTVRTGPLIGLIAQIVLLAGLAQTVGLSDAGWLAGIAYGVVVCAALTHGLERAGADELGPANRVTLARATLVGGVTALIVDTFAAHTSVAVLVALAAVALVLDAVDGQVARRTGNVTALGAGFDMEVDSLLCVYVAGSVGGWVLAIGAMRYALLVATWVLPWTRGPVPPRYWRKVVAATQGIVLVVAAAGVLPGQVVVAALAVALCLLVESFGRDVVWLWRQRLPEPAAEVS
jgi:phosphatidylglycerophosphate synthase